MPVGFTWNLYLLEDRLGMKKEGTKCLLDLLGIGLCTVIRGSGQAGLYTWIFW